MSLPNSGPSCMIQAKSSLKEPRRTITADVVLTAAALPRSVANSRVPSRDSSYQTQSAANQSSLLATSDTLRPFLARVIP